MSESHIAKCAVLLALAGIATASACGCAMFPKQPVADTARSTSDADVRQASFEGDNVNENGGFELKDLSPDNLTKTVKKLSGRGPNKEIAKKAFDEGNALYKQAATGEPAQRSAQFAAAAEKFVEAAERFPNSALEQDALFYAGESYFFADMYTQSTTSYEKLIKAYPNNRYMDKVDQRRFAIAQYWLDLNRKNPEPVYYFNWTDNSRPWRDARGGALRLFDKIRVDAPTGKLADDATLAAANENLLAGKFMKADEYYSDLRTAYPTSEHQFLAHFLGLKAKLNSYLGPNYSSASLVEAEKLIKQMRRQFPVESEKEKDFIDRAAAEVRYKKAEKIWSLGEYYYNRSEYRAAGTHYQQLLHEYNDTPFARQAEQRIEKTAGLPPVPPQKLPWLVDLLPETDKVQPLLEATRKANEAALAESQRADESGPDAPVVGTAPAGSQQR